MYDKLRNIFKSDIPISLKKKVCVLPVITYGTETSTLTKLNARSLKIAQRKMERSILGIKLSDHIKNTEVRKRMGV